MNIYRWVNAPCDSNEVPHYYGCEIKTTELLDLTNIFNGMSFLTHVILKTVLLIIRIVSVMIMFCRP